MLVKFVNQKKESWADDVETCMPTTPPNTNRQSSLHLRSCLAEKLCYLLMWQPRWAFLILAPDDADYECMMDANVKRQKLVKKNILAAQQKQNRFMIGSIVYLRLLLWDQLS